MFGLTVVGPRLAFARLPDRMPAHRLGSIALALTAAGLVLAGAFEIAAGLYAGTALLAVGVAFTTPAFFAAIFSRVPASERGAASGDGQRVRGSGIWRRAGAGGSCGRSGDNPGRFRGRSTAGPGRVLWHPGDPATGGFAPCYSADSFMRDVPSPSTRSWNAERRVIRVPASSKRTRPFGSSGLRLLLLAS